MPVVGRFRARAAALAVGLALAGACGPYHHTGQAAGDLAAVLYFTNESLDQAAVYAVGQGSQQIRIGTVMAGRTDTLTVPPSLVGSGTSIQIVARQLGHNLGPQSGPLSLVPGDELAIRLPSDARTLIVLPPRS